MREVISLAKRGFQVFCADRREVGRARAPSGDLADLRTDVGQNPDFTSPLCQTCVSETRALAAFGFRAVIQTQEQSETIGISVKADVHVAGPPSTTDFVIHTGQKAVAKALAPPLPMVKRTETFARLQSGKAHSQNDHKHSGSAVASSRDAGQSELRHRPLITLSGRSLPAPKLVKNPVVVRRSVTFTPPPPSKTRSFRQLV